MPSLFKYSTLYPTKPLLTNLFLDSVGTLFKSKTKPFTVGKDDKTPQSVIEVLISNGLIIKLYIPLSLNSL